MAIAIFKIYDTPVSTSTIGTTIQDIKAKNRGFLN